jgi:hypothetical protein
MRTSYIRRFGGYIRDYYHPLRNFNAMVSNGLISLIIIILVYHHFPRYNNRDGEVISIFRHTQIIDIYIYIIIIITSIIIYYYYLYYYYHYYYYIIYYVILYSIILYHIMFYYTILFNFYLNYI